LQNDFELFRRYLRVRARARVCGGENNWRPDSWEQVRWK